MNSILVLWYIIAGAVVSRKEVLAELQSVVHTGPHAALGDVMFTSALSLYSRVVRLFGLIMYL